MVRDDPPPDDRPPPPRGFSPLYEKSLPYNACPELAAWSPQLDLLAVVAESNNVLLYRMNGERVWGVTVRKEAGSDDCVKKLRWRPDGSRASRPASSMRISDTLVQARYWHWAAAMGRRGCTT